ncbi:MAG: hypothetical protein V7K90_00670 [Nostoc sp.]|uniref:hypothetical protein n=1 Tax=Nostoc sp. TaxID=1180 RepID=UPI002FFD4D04
MEFCRRSLFISRKGSKEEESNAFSTRRYANGGLRLRTLEILQMMPSLREASPTAGFPAERYANAYALFNEPQRRREYRGGRERSLGRIHILLLMLEPSH